MSTIAWISLVWGLNADFFELLLLSLVFNVIAIIIQLLIILGVIKPIDLHENETPIVALEIVLTITALAVVIDHLYF